MSYLKLENITKSFGKSQVLKEVSFAIAQNEIVALLGESGSGKTTLLRIIAGLEFANSGKVVVNDKIMQDASTFLKTEHRNIGVIFQDYALFPHLNVKQNIAYGLTDKNERILQDFLRIFELEDHAKKRPHQLSGGQQQRVAIARSIIVNPDLLLLDEPFSSLDQSLKRKVRSEISTILRRQNIPSILVTHDPDDAMEMADKIAILQKGEIVQFDTPENIYKQPINEYVGDLTGGINVINGKLVRPSDTKIRENEMGGYKVVKCSFYKGDYFITLQAVANPKEFINVIAKTRVELGSIMDVE
ncbi:iron(III) transport system ATP-binding protein [Lishizhenia tianjinensis]|uniref:Iron(III) transport system ATP-binding protein n=1 Tax=Lishizhenia tianjinensis TaxID=477690 RepID=A0A1I6YTL8_9FLAO|nr:ABC transporter ATP-binding protein [Lishizhenia tianjinensis]SFT53814.1 iron(III) transport system ATP-binding protein [Lishizhenia tianjinensis]